MIFKKLSLTLISAAFLFALVVTTETVVVPQQEAVAQEEKSEKPRRKAKRIDSIRQSNVKIFEKVSEAMDTDSYDEASRLLDKLAKVEDLNNMEKAYLHNFRGSIYFSKDNLSGALSEFKKVVATREGISDGFYNQILYVIAQVLFSQENYKEALKYAQTWFKTQEDPSADAYMLIGQAHYMLKEYDKALPNVQKGIQKYVDLGEAPRESWLVLLSGIYREKGDYKSMLPVVKQLVKHYPKKSYLSTLAGVYNELGEQSKMTALFRAMYAQNLLSSEGEFVTLASLLLSEDNPYPAAMVMEKALNDGTLKKNLKNNRIYSQALYMAREYEKALDPLAAAAKQSTDGKLYNQLAQSYIALNRWGEADAALAQALKKGGLSNPGQALVSQGLVRFELKKYESAKAAFKRAIKHEKTAKAAKNWIKYVDSEVARINELKKEIVISTDVDVS